jgi:hypothetical protein
MAINPYVPATATGNGVQVDFSFTFPYLNQLHVKASINGTLTTAFTFFSANVLRFTVAPSNGAEVRIFRETPADTLAAVLQPGGPIPVVGLNQNFLQSLYYNQETQYDAANQSTAGLQAQITDATNTANTALTVANTQVTFVQAGAGAVGRTLTSKLREVVSVRDFGAIGDGSTDDTAAIQAAITYAQSFYIPETYASSSPGPGVTELFFPFGVYKITAALTVTRSISFRGEGHSEFSTGARILQYTAATDHFRVNPIAQGCSVSWDDLTMTAAGNGGTGGACINITKTTATCNSVRIRRCTFGTPQLLAIKIQSSDDVMIGENLFDVSSTNCISLGTSTAGDVVSNCQILGNTFYSILGTAINLFNVDGLVVSKNRVYPAATKLTRFLDGYNTLPFQLKDIAVTSNVLKGITCLAHLTAINGFVFQGNVGSALGAGAGASLSCLELTGTCSGLVVAGNVLSGSFDTKNFYNDAGATVTKAAISGNSLINTAGAGAALVCSSTSGFIGQNSVSGFASPSVGNQFYTTGNAISVGVISSLAAATYTTTVSGAGQGDKVTLTPSSTTWPVPAGVEISAFISAANTVSIRYVNVTGSAIGVGAHDFGILVTR